MQQNIDLDNEAQLREFFNSPASNVSTEISPDDRLYEGNRNHYFSVGHSALRCIRTAMLLSDKKGVGSILDFACGFGRVLRVLKSAFPAAELTASDVSRAAIDFCSRTLGAEPIQSSEYLEEIKINKTFDLIWVGSLLTHLEPSAFLGFLKLFQSLLSRDGIVVFTTHGRFVARRLPEQCREYGLDEMSVSKLLTGYNTTGFGYVDYPGVAPARVGVTKYGLSVSRPSWVCQQIESLNMRLLSYTERGWDNHQDSVSCNTE